MDFIDAANSLAIPTWEEDIFWTNKHPGEYDTKIKIADLPEAMKFLFKERLKEVKKDELELKVSCPVIKIFRWVFGADAISLDGEIKFAKGNKERIAVYDLAEIIERQIRETE